MQHPRDLQQPAQHTLGRNSSEAPVWACPPLDVVRVRAISILPCAILYSLHRPLHWTRRVLCLCPWLLTQKCRALHLGTRRGRCVSSDDVAPLVVMPINLRNGKARGGSCMNLALVLPCGSAVGC